MIRRALSLFSLLALLFVSIETGGCVPPIPRDVLKLAPESLNQRQLETRQYDTQDEKQILSACVGVLQDLGFTLTESETKLGIIVASKDRSAVDPAQVAVATTLVLLAAFGRTCSDALNRTDATQRIRASVVTASVSGNKIRVRVTFQRIVWDRGGKVSRVETLSDPHLYEGFFEKLSKSIFLEAHTI